MNHDYGQEMLDESTNNLQSQKHLTYDFSTLNKFAAEEEDVKPSMGSLSPRNANCLRFCQININSIRNKLWLIFSLVLNNIDVLLINA